MENITIRYPFKELQREQFSLTSKDEYTSFGKDTLKHNLYQAVMEIDYIWDDSLDIEDNLYSIFKASLKKNTKKKNLIKDIRSITCGDVIQVNGISYICLLYGNFKELTK